MAQVQDSTIHGSPSPDTAIPVRVSPEIDGESVLSDETIQRLREPLKTAVPVTVLLGIDDERVSISMPVRLLTGVRPSPPQPPRPCQRRTAAKRQFTARHVKLPTFASSSASVTPPIVGSAPVPLPPENTTQSVIGAESEELSLCRRDDKGIDMDCAKYKKYEKLRRAAIDDGWHVVKKFIENDPEALTAKLSDTGQTILHYMVNSKNMVEFVCKLVEEKMKPEDLEHTDMKGLTVLSTCAIVGNIKAAEIIVGKNLKLLNIRDNNKNLPLHYAAKFGHKDMVQFLLAKEEDRGRNKINNKEKEEDRGPQKEKEVLYPSLTGESGVKLVENLITSNLHGIALELLEAHPNLAREQLQVGKRVLETLAQKPLGFESGSQLGFLKRLIYKCIPDSSLPHIKGGGDTEDNPDSSLHDIRGSGDVEDPKTTSEHCFTKSTQHSFPQRTSATCSAMCKKLYVMLYCYIISRLVPGIQSIHDTKLKHKQTCELVKLICEGRAWNSEEASDFLASPMLIAARLGIQEIVDEIIKAYPPSVDFLDKDGHNVFQLAVLHRQEKVFSLIFTIGAGIDWAANFRANKDRNNILHLAGKLGPSIQVSRAALQMQRELQWYKAVENLFRSSLQEQKNSDGLTPRELFTKEHTDLVKAGQEWIKQVAQSCSVVAALIITVTFAAAITVPGGNDNQGKPNYLNEKTFLLFTISNAVALFFSTHSVLMFLGILTSSYLEEDFLESLLRKITICLLTVFISIVAMMIAFLATLHLLFFDTMRFWVVLLAAILFLPVALYVLMQFSLLIEMIASTYCPSFIKQPKDSFAAKSKRKMRKIS